MKDIRIAATSDWHLGNSDSSLYPSNDQIQKALQNAFEKSVDAFVIAGDFVDQGNVAMAHVAAGILRPFIEKGMPVIGIVGNHDFHEGNANEVTKILAATGVHMLEGDSYTLKNKTGDRSATILGVSGEIGPEYDSWWRENGWSEEGKKKAHAAAATHRDALQKGLEEASGDSVVVLTHRSVIPDTIGTQAKQGRFVSAQTEGFESIIDANTKGRPTTIIHGHDHGTLKSLWEGFPEGVTRGGNAVYNVAAPLSMRLNKSLVRIITV